MADRSPNTPGEFDVIFHFAWRNPRPGVHIITARALGLPEGAIQSEAIRIRVLEPLPDEPFLTFIAPDQQEAFSAPADVPISLSSFDPQDFIGFAEILANGQRIGFADYCPPDADCGPPEPGELLGLDFYPDENWITPGFWRNVETGNYTLIARGIRSNGLPIESAPLQFTVGGPAPAMVRASVSAPYAIEGHSLNYGELRLIRTGNVGESLTVSFSVGGTAMRGSDYWLEFDPCKFCLRPSIPIDGHEIVIPAGMSSVTIGVNANFEFNPPPGFVEPALENVLFRILAPAPGGETPDYLVGSPAEVELFVVDQTEPNVASLTIIEPADGARYSAGENIPIRVLSVDPDGYIGNAEIFVDGQSVGVASYCPPNANCSQPPSGEVLILDVWALGRSWKDPPPGDYVITARGLRRDGGIIESAPVGVTVSRAQLLPTLRADGSVLLTLSPGAYAGTARVEASSDLRRWEYLGDFTPGDAAATFVDTDAANFSERFYRVVR